VVVGLRNRVALAFGTLALGLSVLLAVLAWTLVTQSVLRQTSHTALVEAALDRAEVQAALDAGSTDVPGVLEGLPGSDAVAEMAQVGSQWYGTKPTLGPTSLPTALVSLVADGHEATQRVRVDGRLYLAVGLPLRARGDAYVELYSLAEVERGARSLSLGLTGAAVVTALLGIALGRAVSKLSLRPLAVLNRAAARVAAGRLDTRLEAGGDPDLVDLASSFNDTVADLEHRVVADARFAVDVSHELRTPLTTMLNSMQVIKNREQQLPASVREPVDLLSAELERFRQLVVDLLEISRHDAGDQVVAEDVCVADLVRRAADSAAGRALTIVEPDAAQVTLRVDKRRLERVVANLVGNAQTHGHGCTEVRVTSGQDVLRILVEDAGPGVEEARRDLVFERFSRGRVGPPTGVGLGLAIVQRHVAVHDGRVFVEGRPEGGARFVVELPRARQ
jgi:signal transduction histidine kinase